MSGARKPRTLEEAAGAPQDRREERLQKILASAGIASSRKSEEFIVSGRVRVNGKTVAELGAKADPERDHIRVDGKLLRPAVRLRYFMLNKPRAVVSTASDPQGRRTVMEFFSRTGLRLFPVGRLDYQSEGLLLFTNDGELTNALSRPAAKVEKTYLVKIAGTPSPRALDQLRAGVMIDKGRPGERPGRVMTQPARIRLVRGGDNPWYELSLTEGRNREIRKMLEEVGHHAEKIRRVGYGPLVLDLPPGEMRELSEEEVRLLKRAAGGRAGKAAAGAPKKARPALRRAPRR